MDTTGTDRREYLAMPVEERPHLYPDKPPSNTTYNGWGENLGCRCSLCTEAHRVAAREYLEAKIAGTWTDRRKTGKRRGLIHDLAEMADRYPELNAMLQRYGHWPVVIQIEPEPESMIDEPIGAGGEPEPVVQERLSLPAAGQSEVTSPGPEIDPPIPHEPASSIFSESTASESELAAGALSATPDPIR
jgi:hypothetical protein